MIGKDEAPHPYASDMMDAYKSLSTAGVITGTITTTAEPRRWKFCPECGTKLEPTWKHCPECGGVIGQTAAPWIPANPLYLQPWVSPNTYPYITWGPNVAGSTTGIQLCGDGRIVGGSTYTSRPGDQIMHTA
jgi:hypothetical protein